MDRNLAEAISRASIVRVEGEFERHVSMKVRTLTGSRSGGRWGQPGAYPVLYLGRPTESVIVEAYRHLVDDVEGARPDMVQPRRLLTCSVSVTQILDLRDEESQRLTGLAFQDLLGPHAPCQRVGSAAHQLGLHGLIAPAATGLGETLALFEQHVPQDELPNLIAEETWQTLPADPREARSEPRGSTAPD